MKLSTDQIDYLKQSIVGLEECHTAIDTLRSGLQEEFDAMPEKMQIAEEGETFTELVDSLDNIFSDIEKIISTLYTLTEKPTKKVR